MIHFKKVRWKNFISTGNRFTEVILDRSRTTLIIGENGAGKSTVLDALCFGLFGKPYRPIKKNQLINSINSGNTLVEVEFKIGTNEFLVRRGIKPNIFEIIRNDEPMNQDAHSKDFQKVLEDQILKLNYKSFLHDVSRQLVLARLWSCIRGIIPEYSTREFTIFPWRKLFLLLMK